jgi:hypothetical protein
MIQLKEKQILEQIQEFLTDCDEDALAMVAGDLFGGFCEPFMNGEYLFTPNENYMGAFGEDGESEEEIVFKDEFPIGTEVYVSPAMDDDFREFRGRIEAHKEHFVVVIDQDDNCFDVHAWQIEKCEEE